MAAEREQVAVSRDEEVGLGGDGGRDNVIVVAICGDHGRSGEGSHQLDGIDVIGKHLVSGATDQREACRRHGADKDLAQLFQKCCGRK